MDRVALVIVSSPFKTSLLAAHFEAGMSITVVSGTYKGFIGIKYFETFTCEAMKQFRANGKLISTGLGYLVRH